MSIGVRFSLFGLDEYYLKGLEKNHQIIQDIYPDSKMYVHTDQPNKVKRRCPNATVIEHHKSKGVAGTFWRFLSYGSEEVVLFRDADSLVNIREKAAVDEWLESGLGIHAMLDHDAHSGEDWPVMAGMWGARRNALPYDFNYLVKWWLKNKGPFNYHSDQWFLRRYIWPYIASGDGLLHTHNVQHKWRGKKWPEHEPYDSFVGSRIPK